MQTSEGLPALNNHDLPDMDDEHDAALLQHFLSSDQSSKLPDRCSCHEMLRGSCPANIKEHFKIIKALRNVPNVPANMDGLRIPLPNPSFPIPAWQFALQGYFDADEILAMLRYGWDFSFTSPPAPKDATRNLASASIAPQDVDIYIETELAHGSLLGPFKEGDIPFQVFRSPLGTAPKIPVRRTITDCSQVGQGINQFISAHEHRGQTWKIFLPSTKTIVSLIKENRRRFPGQQLGMWKADYSRWYRWFWIDPGQAIFFAIRWRGLDYLDMCLSFGNRAAAQCAQRIMWAILWVFRTRINPQPNVRNSGFNCSCSTHCQCGDITCAGYVDDTIGIAPLAIAQYQYEAFLQLCHNLGLRLSKSAGHLSPPDTQCVALGLLFNLENNTVSMPADKLKALLELLESWFDKTYATDRELASLVGRLLYAANVIRSGRLLTNRVLATKRLAASIDRPVLVDSACLADLRWWHAALSFRNGMSFLEHDSDVTIAMDASGAGWEGGLPGLAGFNFDTSEFWCGPPPQHLVHLDICDLETVCHVVSCHIWAHTWQHKQILGQTDNQISYFLFTNGRARDEVRLQMARSVASFQVTHNFVWTSEWISTHVNVLPDAASRFGSEKYRKIFFDECTRRGITPKRIPLLPKHFNFSEHLGS